ncbi:MAG: molybdopterin-containing oxidoreductase family protein [Gammaproteobacteria bacterium]
MKTIHGACPHDCPDTCAWDVKVDDDGRAVSVTGKPDHPFTQGALCSKLKRYTARVYNEKRVLKPLIRSGPKGSGEFREASLEEAFGLVVERLRSTLGNEGPLGAMPCNFAGTIGLLHRYAGDRFFGHMGATGVDRQICGNVAWEGVASTVGAADPMVPDDLVHSKFILIWGANTVATNLHLWSGPIREARRAGARVVVVDPVRTPTAAHADWHVQPRPGTDAALALGMMHIIVRDELHDAEYIERHTIGFDQLSERVAEFPPERVAEITGVPVDDLETLAREYATTTPAVLRLMVGMERYSNGGMSFRTVACLPSLIGAWRHVGGGILQFVSSLFAEALDHDAIFPTDEPEPARTVHLAQLGKVLTDPDMAPPITWMLVYNLNPVVTLPNQNLIIEGLKREDLFTVVHEQFMTDTARYADVILPATTQLEHWELMPSWGHTYLAINPPAIEPLGEAISNTELFRRLSAALGYTEDKLLSDDVTRIRQILASGTDYVDGITFDSLMENGWAKLNTDSYAPYRNGEFKTPSGKTEFYSETLAEQGYDPLPNYIPLGASPGVDDNKPFRLVTSKTSHFLNSEYVNLPHRGTEKHVPEIHINPEDAEAHDVASGDMICMFNELGEVEASARVCEDTAAGVLFMPFNWWASSTRNGQSANALTPDSLSDRGIGSNAFDARVDIRKAG